MPEYDTAVLQRLPYGRGWPEAPELPTVPLSLPGLCCAEVTAAAIGVSLLLMIQHTALNGAEDKKKCCLHIQYMCVDRPAQSPS